MNRMLSLALSAILLPSMAIPAAAQTTSPVTQEVTPEMKTLVAGQNAFATELYARLRSQNGNLFFSPHSISVALTMTWSGAAGPTADEMAAVLHLPAEKGKTGRIATIQAAASLQKHLKAIGGGKFQLNVANALWGQRGYPFKDDFLTLIKTNFDGGLAQVDFSNEPVARAAINSWAEAQTQDKIKDLIAPGILTPITRLVLANAIYFKAAWAESFKVAATKKALFHHTADKAVEAEMMNQTGSFAYSDAGAVRILEMPYDGQAISMAILLPARVDGLEELESGLSAENLAGWLGQLKRERVHVSMPKFTVAAGRELAGTLMAMGLNLAFDADRADFSGMTNSATEPLHISDVAHKAFVDVNEEGTEAAAATAVTMRTWGGAMPAVKPIEFVADHPFLFLIRDMTTGDILFMGRLVDPTM